MADLQISTKRLAISKTEARTVIIVGIASFISIFCLTASKTVFSQIQYQSRVTTAKNAAHSQLKSNLSAFGTLSSSYNTFVSQPTNIIGGSSTIAGNNDGNNATIILDALPDSYDFPALTDSIEKILNSDNVQITGIGGTDEQLSEQSDNSSTSPQPVSMPFTFNINNASYQSINQVITTLQESIRPIQIDQLTVSGGGSNMTLSVNAHTYYQPALSLKPVYEEIH